MKLPSSVYFSGGSPGVKCATLDQPGKSIGKLQNKSLPSSFLGKNETKTSII
jgi:hypothetical protein